MYLLLTGLAAMALLAACSGPAPAPAPAPNVPTVVAEGPVRIAPTPEDNPATSAAGNFGRTAEGLFARGRADAPVVIYDYSDFL